MESDGGRREQLPPARGPAASIRHLTALVAYLALAVAITWPLVRRLGSAIPHDLGDPLGFTWVFWWNAQALPLTQRWLDAPIFYPSTGSMVFQDSLVGVWPFTTAVQWLGASPLVAYNLLFIGSFAAAAFTSYLLCARLFRDDRAAFAGGLVFGFALYRMAQLPHVNILLTFWIPLTLLGLHEYLATRRWRWIALAAGCWALQALTAGYFLAYSTVLIGLWALFFLRWRLRDHAKVWSAFALALAAIWPWLSLYRAVHERYGFQRGLGEAEFWSADVTSLLKAPHLLAIWGPIMGDATKEDHFFPGLTLACVSATVVIGSHYWSRPRITASTKVFLAVALAFAAVATSAALFPTSFEIFGVRVWLSRAYKPLSWVWLSLLLAFVASLPVRRVLRERSVAGFYALAAFTMWILALGPSVKFMGERIWYKAPYSWLLVFPGSDAVRVPARFWMLVVLALAVVVAYGMSRLRSRRPMAAGTMTALVCVGLVAEAWLAKLPLPDPPERFPALEARPARVPVLEVPLGSTQREIGAMYRSIYHHARLVNGYSAYEPPSFISLRAGLDNGDAAALVPYSELTALDILVHTGADKSDRYEALVREAGAALVTSGSGFRLYHLPRRPPMAEPPFSEPATIARITQPTRGDITALLTSDDESSFVITSALDLELARPCQVDEVVLAAEAGLISVAVRGSAGQEWDDLWSGSVAERSVRGALSHPRWPRLRLRFPPKNAGRLQIALRVPPGSRVTATHAVRVFGHGCT